MMMDQMVPLEISTETTCRRAVVRAVVNLLIGQIPHNNAYPPYPGICKSSKRKSEKAQDRHEYRNRQIERRRYIHGVAGIRMMSAMFAHGFSSKMKRETMEEIFQKRPPEQTRPHQNRPARPRNPRDADGIGAQPDRDRTKDQVRQETRRTNPP